MAKMLAKKLQTYVPLPFAFNVKKTVSDLAQLYSLFYPHVNSLTDVFITPVLHMLTLWDPILCAHQGTCSILAGLKMAA
jgi:hypothetical protein